MSSDDMDGMDDMLAAFDSALEEQNAGEALAAGEDVNEDVGPSAGFGQGGDVENPKPWVDYIPAKDFKESENLEERVRQGFEMVDAILKEREARMINYVATVGDTRYYPYFLEELNQTFRCSVRMKARKVAGKFPVKTDRDLSKIDLLNPEPASSEELGEVEGAGSLGEPGAEPGSPAEGSADQVEMAKPDGPPADLADQMMADSDNSESVASGESQTIDGEGSSGQVASSEESSEQPEPEGGQADVDALLDEFS